MTIIATFEQTCHAISALEHAPEHAELAVGDPRTPFGVAGGPCSDFPVTDDALDRAFELLVSFYEHSPAIISRAERALAVAKDRTHCAIHADGGMTIQGSRRYQVTDDGCTCKDFFVRDGLHAGMCKHSIARELWRLAQATQIALGALPAEPPTLWAFCMVPGVALGRALKNVLRHAVDAQAITVQVTNRVLSISVDGTPIAQLAGDDGCGVRALTISNDTFAMLCADYASFLRSFGRDSPATQVLIDHTTATVALLADGFACEAAGSPA